MLKILEELIHDFIRSHNGILCDTLIIHPNTDYKLQEDLRNNMYTPIPIDNKTIIVRGIKLTVYRSYDVIENHVILK